MLQASTIEYSLDVDYIHHVFLINKIFLGEQKKLEAIASEIENHHRAQIHYVDANMRRIPLLRETLRFLSSIPYIRELFKTQWVRKRLFKLVFRNGKYPEQIEPTIILTTQSAHEMSANLFAIAFNAKWFHIGPVKRSWPHSLTACICTWADNTQKLPATIHVEIDPTRSKLMRRSYRKTGTARHAAVMIGALPIHIQKSKSSLQNIERSVDALVSTLKRYSQDKDIRWHITTSPRTTAASEELLRIKLERNKACLNIETLSLFSTNKIASIEYFLSQVDLAFVTEDSRSMLCDVVALGIPVYVLSENYHHLSGQHSALIDQLEHKKRVARINIHHMPDRVSSFEGFNVLTECWSKQFNRQFNLLIKKHHFSL